MVAEFIPPRDFVSPLASNAHSQSAAAAAAAGAADNIAEPNFEDPFEDFDLFSLDKDDDHDFLAWIDDL
jgi:hypothetical protein